MAADHAPPKAAEHAGLTLNKGQKWNADDHTEASIGRMDALLAPLPADVAAYHALGEALQAETQTLIRGCTMTGADHDQLHVVLEKLLPQVAALRTGVVLADLKAGRSDLMALLAAYHRHFE